MDGKISELCILLLSPVSIPMITHGSAESIRFPDWKFTFRIFMLTHKGFCLVDAACGTAEVQDIGGPGLLMLLEVVEFNTTEGIFGRKLKLVLFTQLLVVCQLTNIYYMHMYTSVTDLVNI